MLSFFGKKFIFHLCKSNWHIANHQNSCFAWVGKWSQVWIMIYLKSHSFRKKNCKLTSVYSIYSWLCYSISVSMKYKKIFLILSWLSVSKWHMNFSQGGYSFLLFSKTVWFSFAVVVRQRKPFKLIYYRDDLLKREITTSAKLKTWIWSACKCLYFRE